MDNLMAGGGSSLLGCKETGRAAANCLSKFTITLSPAHIQ
jgi:hypothetical protein